MNAPSPPLAKLSRTTASHYTWGDACDGWHMLADPALSVILERMPAGASEVRHRHRRAQQLFFVLQGTLTIEADGAPQVLGVEEALHVPAGIAHRVANDGSEPVTFLVVSEPPSHGDRVE